MGERFGNYDLIEKVAVGGMAEIFKARSIHEQGVEKIVCIKRIHPALSADRNFVAMFIDEARLGVSMVHGNIVPVFDFGYVDGHYFLAMEYVAGQDLSSLCGRARVVGIDWPPELAIYVVMELLEGLSYAHHKRDDQGRPLELVHRDVSPSNLLISHDGQVKLLDFGIARSQAREFETRTGVIKGKPGYMSPEQAAGQKVDARADVWSCGAVLHELITGAKLKDGRQRCGDEAIDKLIERSLYADREDRFADASDFQRALGDILAERRLRPTARDLAAFIEQVETTTAPGEDWDMQSTAVEAHLARALEPISTDGGSMEAPTEMAEAVTELAGATRKLTVDQPRPRRRLALVALLALVLLGGGGVLAYRYLGPGDAPAVDGDRPGAGPSKPDVVAPPAIDPGEVALGGQPPGAAIWIDGADTGKVTPDQLVLPPGEHRVALRLPGHQPWTNVVQLAEGKQIQLEPTLEPLPAPLTIKSVPPGAAIELDGRARGTAPLTLDDLKPGRHAVLARLPGRTDARQEVVVVAGEAQVVELELKERGKTGPATPKGRATLNIASLPWADVILDGQPIGRTPIRGRQIAPGRHKVVLKNEAKSFSRTHTFTVKPGEEKLIRERF